MSPDRLGAAADGGDAGAGHLAQPSGCIRVMNCSTLADLPVISKTKELLVASTTRARKASAILRASTRCSPTPATLISAISRSMALPMTVRSATECTGTMRSSWARIWSSTMSVPAVTMVTREMCASCSVSDTVSDSML
jgi:hypothetical protein